jgi:ATP-binding cassette subfamily C protein
MGAAGSIREIRTLLRQAAAFLGTFSGFAGKRGAIGSALVGVAGLLDGASVALLIPILNAVVSRGASQSYAGPVLRALGLVSPLTQLAAMLGAFIALSLVRSALGFARDMYLGRLQTAFTQEQRNAVIRVLAAAPWNRIAAMSHARINSLLTNEIGRLSSASQFMIQGSVSLVMLVVQGALAMILAPALASAVIVLLLIGAVALAMGQGRIRDLGEQLVTANRAMMGATGGLLGGLKAAVAQNGQGRFVAEFETIQTMTRERTLEFQRRQAKARRFFGIGSALMGSAVVFGGIALGTRPAVLITLVVIFSRMAGPAQQLQLAIQNFVFGLPAFISVRALVDELARESEAAPDPRVPPPGPLVARGVRYLHPGGGGVKQADFTIAPGAFVGVAGPSGAGKTTLIDVLTGLLVPQAGALSVGGVPLDPAYAAGWRQQLAYVPQDGFVFNDSVRRNLTWACPDADDESLWRALALSGGDAIVRRLPEGLNTIVGERGALLSGGERQRITLARALIGAPRLLVLDEALNAVDADSETAVLGRLALLDPRPTIVMVSHRAASLVHCSQVITVEMGVARDATG